MIHLLRPFSREFQDDPYPTYRLLREQAPVYRAELLGFPFFVLTGYSEVAAVLRDARLSAQAAGGGLLPRALRDGNVLFTDPPQHTRLRGLLNKAFLPQTLEALRPRLHALAETVLERALFVQQKQGHFDVVHDLGVPMSIGSICTIFGLPDTDSERLERWTEALTALLDLTRILPCLRAAHRAADEFVAYFAGILAERRRATPSPTPFGNEPPRDLLAALLAARDQQDRLSDDELVATAIFTLMAGHETVTSAVGTCLLALAAHPTELRRLLSDPGLASSAFDETLRYDPPVHLTTRLAREELELGGQRIGKGEAVVAVLAAANRDPQQFADADRFVIDRRDNRHLAFSHGPHYCVGAALARLQGSLLLSALATRQRVALKVDVQKAVRKPGIVLRGLRELKARFAEM